MSTAPMPPRKSPVVINPSKQNNFWLILFRIIQSVTLVLVLGLVLNVLPFSTETDDVTNPKEPLIPAEAPAIENTPQPGITLSMDKDTYIFGESIHIFAETSNLDGKTIKIELIKKDGNPLSGASKATEITNQKTEITFEQPFDGMYIVGEWAVRAQVVGADNVKDEKQILIEKPIPSIVISPKIDLGNEDGYVIIPDVSVIKVDVQKVNDVELIATRILKIDGVEVPVSADGFSWKLSEEKLKADAPGIKVLTAKVEYAQVLNENGEAFIDDTTSLNLLAHSEIESSLFGKNLIKYDFLQKAQPDDAQVILSKLTCGDDNERLQSVSLGSVEQYSDYIRVMVTGWIKRTAFDPNFNSSVLPVETIFFEPFDMNNVLYPKIPSAQYCILKKTAGNSIVYVTKQGDGANTDVFQFVLLGLLKSK